MQLPNVMLGGGLGDLLALAAVVTAYEWLPGTNVGMHSRGCVVRVAYQVDA